MCNKQYLLLLIIGVFMKIVLNNAENKTISISRILEGIPSRHEDYRYHVTVMKVIKNTPVLVCGGAIITRWHILTAAHCVNKLRREDLLVRHGKVSGPTLDNPHDTVRTFHGVAKIYLPKRYSSSRCRKHHNDIAILKVSRPFDLANSLVYAKVNLPEFDNDYEGKEATVTGYGPDYSPEQHGIADKDKILRYVSTEIRAMPTIVISNEECQNDADVVLTEGSLCAEAIDPASRTCFEDDGGPLVHDGTIIGILNDRQCDPKTPELFTRVSSYLHFSKAVLDHQITCDILVL